MACRRRWGRRWMSPGEMAGLAGVVLAAAAGVSTGHAIGKHADPAAVVSAPSGSGYTPSTWAAAFIGALGDQDTPCDQAGVVVWETAEGGNWDNLAQYNPLNTARREPGSWRMPGYNPDNVQAYPTWQEGMQANLSAITNGLYRPILSALAAGTSAQAVANAVGASPWGTPTYEASC
jgi:hypothetical protein